MSVSMSLRPSAYNLLGHYEAYFKNPKPCPQVKYSCAVRLSVALVKEGFDFADFKPQKRVHRGRRNDVPEPHVPGATELARYLGKKWGEPTRVRGRNKSRASFYGRPGIVYFNDCFKRNDGTAGDHIDLWNGWHYMNEALGLSADGGVSRREDLFRRANWIWFFRLF